MTIFQGLGVAMITPYNADRSLDISSFESLADEMIERGADALIIGGSTGEPHALTAEEKILLIKRALYVAKGRVPVIAGVNRTVTTEAKAEALLAAEAGADALLVLTPYLSKCTEEGCYLHFKETRKAGVPVIAYNVPARTGYEMPASVLKRLVDDNLVSGIKQACADMHSTMEYLSAIGEKGSLYSGEDDLCVSMRALGASGVISVAALLMPEAMKGLFDLPFEVAGKLQLEMNGLINALFAEVNPVPVKCLLAALGKCKNVFRLPLTQAKPETEERLFLQAKRAGLL